MKKRVFILIIGFVCLLPIAGAVPIAGKSYSLSLPTVAGKQTIFEVENTELYTVSTPSPTLPTNFLVKGER
jgi:hypothetical protein